MKKPKTPTHLRPETRRWFASVTQDYQLEPHHLKILQTAAESWDRMTMSREAIAEHGMTYTDRLGSVRARPEVNIERDSRVSFLRALRELALDVSAPDAPRAPGIGR